MKGKLKFPGYNHNNQLEGQLNLCEIQQPYERTVKVAQDTNVAIK